MAPHPKIQEIPEQRDREKRMMNNPLDWPMWPYLPLKRINTHEPSCGYILAQHGRETTVYLANIFDRGWKGPIDFKEYESFDAIIDDGWVVD